MRYSFLHSIFSSDWWRLLRTFLVTAILLNFALILEVAFPSGVRFKRIETEKTISWVSSEPVSGGDYFISAGRVQGACSLLSDGEKLDGNVGLAGLSERSSLFLGSPLAVEAGGAKTISLSCSKELGSPVRLIHSIHLNNYRIGSFIHLVRELTDLGLPLALAAFFIAFLVFSNRANYKEIFDGGILTGVITFAYLVSLANFPRLFFSNIDSLFLHSVLKFGFVLSLLNWLSGGIIKKRIFVGAFLCAALTFSGFYFLAGASLFKVYMAFCHFIPLGVLWIIFSLKMRHSQQQTWFRFVPIIFTSVLDLLFLHFGAGAFFAPVSTIAVFGLATGDYIRNLRASATARKVLAKVSSLILDGSGSIGKLSKISEEFSQAIYLEKWSIYLDAYFLGKCARPSQEMNRISSSSKHVHPEDPGVSLVETSSFGESMRHAIQQGSPLLSRSESDGCLFVVFPVTGVGCLNFSATEKHKGDWEQIKTIVDEVFQDISVAVTTMVRGELASNLSVSAIREELGAGTHDVSFGVIFADAVGYTQNVQRSEKFVEFFQFEYIPALLRHLGRNVALKDLFGDELFLVVRDFSVHDDLMVHHETALAIQSLQEFVDGYGARMCEATGFDPLTFKVGAHSGQGQIIVTGTDLSLSGPVIEAKRCQGRARPEEPFVSKILFEFLSPEQREEAAIEVYAAKKEILSGYRLRRRAA